MSRGDDWRGWRDGAGVRFASYRLDGLRGVGRRCVIMDAV